MIRNVKGTVDYLPADEAVRRRVRRMLEETFSAYGCQPLETPILNERALMASKYAGGAEILQEMYTLSDRGGRDLALRYDLTMPFAKVVAQNRALTLPFKRYEIGKVFRDGPIKTGRLREFTQCDVDVVGVNSQAAEAELMEMAITAFTKLGMPVTIQYNNRKLLCGLLTVFGVAKAQLERVVLTLDKMEKIDRPTLIAELASLSLTAETLAAITAFLDEATEARITELAASSPVAAEGLAELQELQRYLASLQLTDCCVFNPFLARGLAIYRGTIYEIFLQDGSIRSSIGSGGRYDNAIGGLVGDNEVYATVGISFGLDVIFTAFAQQERNETFADVYIVPLATEAAALQLATALRTRGLRVDVELSGKKLRKAMMRANRERIRYVIVLGSDEVTAGRYKLRDMETGEEVEEFFLFS